jgi:UDP-N-acetyl-D-glucosamine/UDP-N-acetyl-D-galactosamine dehydrogenase
MSTWPLASQGVGVRVAVHDPWAKAAAARVEYGLELTPWELLPKADAMIVAVAHDRFRRLEAHDLACKLKPGGTLVDVKSSVDAASLKALGLKVWRL